MTDGEMEVLRGLGRGMLARANRMAGKFWAERPELPCTVVDAFRLGVLQQMLHRGLDVYFRHPALLDNDLWLEDDDEESGEDEDVGA